MKYKIGDTVEIREDLIDELFYETESETYHIMAFVGDMKKYKGKKAKITRVNSENGCYNINLDLGAFYWSMGMFKDTYLHNGYLFELKNGKKCVYKNGVFYGKDGFKRQIRCYNKEDLRHKKIDELSVVKVYGIGDSNDVFSVNGRELIWSLGK